MAKRPSIDLTPCLTLTEMILPALTRVSRLVVATLVAIAPFSALADQKRVAIVYSETSKQGYGDDFAYYQAYMPRSISVRWRGFPTIC